MAEIYLYSCCSHCGCNPKQNNHPWPCSRCQDID